jgi:hypothetical protein
MAHVNICSVAMNVFGVKPRDVSRGLCSEKNGRRQVPIAGELRCRRSRDPVHMLRVAWRGADGCFHGPGRNGVLSACRSLQSIDVLVASGTGMLQKRLGAVYKTGGFQVSQIRYVAVQGCCCSGVAGLSLARDVRCFFPCCLGRNSFWGSLQRFQLVLSARLSVTSKTRSRARREVGGRGCV